MFVHIIWQMPSANTQPGARLDIAANGVWEAPLKEPFFDVRVFNPHAASNRHADSHTVYRKHELIKKGPTNKTLNRHPSPL